MAAIGLAEDRICAENVLQLQDISLHALVGSRQWEILPAGATFVNGTDAQSAMPEVLFPGPGTYEVYLTVTTTEGTDRDTAYVTVDPGTALPLNEDFEGGLWPPLGWALDSHLEAPGWEPTHVTGPDSLPTLAAGLAWPSQGTSGTRDILWTQRIDLRGADAPQVAFDLAYAGSSDSLELWVVPDCGEGIPVRLWVQAGPQLQTSPTLSLTNWQPRGPSDWRRDSADLSPFAGQSLRLFFAAVSGSGPGGRLFLDNIGWTDRGIPAPAAQISSPAGIVCAGTTVSFTDASGGGVADTYTWDFGTEATPSTATGPGPHQVVFSGSGTRSISLTASNAAGSTSIDRVIEVLPAPDATFSFSGDSTSFTFIPADTTAWSYWWDFGDGDSSTEVAPVHTFPTAAPYPVTLIVTNACGQDTAVTALVGVADLLSDLRLALHPNPGNGQFGLVIDAPTATSWTLRLYDLRGRHIRTQALPLQGAAQQHDLDWRDLPAGAYLLQASSKLGVTTLRLLVQ